jgi:DNA-binding SARP family transcriptional activator
MLNLSLVCFAKGNGERALACADESIALLGRTSAGVELVAARLAKAHALALLARIDEARQEIDLAKADASPSQSQELAAEIATIEALLGEGISVRAFVEASTSAPNLSDDGAELAAFGQALVRISDGDLLGAAESIAKLRFGMPATTLAFEAQRHLLVGLVLALQGDKEATNRLKIGTGIAKAQGAALWAEYGQAMLSLVGNAGDASRAVIAVAQSRPVVLSMAAELVTLRLPHLSSDAVAEVVTEAVARPWRWRGPARRAIFSRDPDLRVKAARMLDQIGERSDVGPLRKVGRSARGGDARLGYALARRLAPRVLVEDLGRVRIASEGRITDGTAIRRKVLALICLLLTRPRFALTRDEVLDSLWPDHDPGSALNSLNQTVYFLRRVFEPEYADSTTPGYVGQDGETIWLDAELVDCTSRRCLEIARSMPNEPTPEGALQLSALYRGRFAMDFAYEEWASDYRDALHASYLRVMEHAIRADIDTGHLDRGTFLAERAVEVDPEAEEIQLALARLYRQSGAHAAAAEVYGHYSRAMKELGVEPVPLSDL